MHVPFLYLQTTPSGTPLFFLHCFFLSPAHGSFFCHLLLPNRKGHQRRKIGTQPRTSPWS